jgi:pyruvate ferredoxin oxidoreductase alpha subunit
MVTKRIIKALTGASAVAEAMRQINPDVIAAFPITPQTPIMHAYSQFVADGVVDTEMILVESEHSAMSAVVGASAAGARAMTATASNGLALMHEIVYIAASSRLPILMPIVNRALSGPINIHCDHSDSMAERDSGWMQIYCEDAQEAYDYSLIALKTAENKEIQLPIMVCQDGFITSHSVENVGLLDDKIVKKFIGKYTSLNPLLDTKNPYTFGPLDLFDYYFEHKRQQADAMEKALKVFMDVCKDYYSLTGTRLGYFETYELGDADVAIVTMSSTAGTAKEVVDDLRSKGKNVGLLKLNLFRPFPTNAIIKVLEHVKSITVLNRSDSFGATGGPLFTEIKSALYNSQKRPLITNYIYGLGGREINPPLIKKVYDDLFKTLQTGKPNKLVYLGVRD